MISAKEARELKLDRPTRIKRSAENLLKVIDEAVRNSATDFGQNMYVGVRTDMFDDEVIDSVRLTLEDLGYEVAYHEETYQLRIGWDK